MSLDDRSLEELSGLFLEEEATECAEELARLAAERALPADAPIVESLLRSGRLTAELVREAKRRAADRLVEALQAGRAADLSKLKRFGRYALLRELGRGGLGRVWLAWDPDLRRLIALKILAAQGEEHLRRMRREAQVAAQLEHPRIARVYELGEAHGVPYIAMQFIDGDSLEGVTLPPLDAARVILDAARVVQFAHERGIVHRDLKPGNLMRRGVDVFVVDFGLAKPLGWEESVSAAGRIMGTLPYMSPEQAEGRVVGPAGDVYSLGATLYRLATGRAPVEAGNVMELISKLQHREIVPARRANAAVPQPLAAVIGQAMEEESRRYPTAATLADDLERAIRGEPVLARPAGAFESLGRALARNRLLMWTGALFLALLVWIVLFGESNAARAAQLAESADRKIAAGEYRAALEEIDTALRLVGDREDLKTRKALCEDRLRAREVEGVDRAARKLETARALLEEARLTLYRKGASFSSDFFAKLDAALSDARASAAARDTSTARYFIGAILHLRGDYDEALVEYSHALKLEPGHARSLLARARAYVDQAIDALFSGREPDSTWYLDSAKRAFDELPRLPEGEIESEISGGWRLVAAGRPEEAAAFARERLGKSEEFAVVLGVAQSRLGAPREAVRSFSAAIDRRPNYYQAFFFRGALLAPINADYALKELDQALAIHPRYVPCLLARAQLRLEKGDSAGAVADWTLAARLRPELESELHPKIDAVRGR